MGVGRENPTVKKESPRGKNLEEIMYRYIGID